MRTFLTTALIVALAVSASAYDLGNQAPVKPVVTYPENVPNPERQGGDTIFTAFTIPSLPFTDTGTTAGYTNDYDEVCPYTGSTAPDVAYVLTPVVYSVVSIDLCGSSFDTKVYVYDADLALIACNDDFYFGPPCGMYTSKLEGVALAAGGTYYIVIDGYGNAAGEYQIAIDGWVPCELAIPAGAIDEGEPPLVPYYEDCYNGGCQYICFVDGVQTWIFLELVADAQGELVFHGRNGWFTWGASNYRDSDYFKAYRGPQGAITVEVDAAAPFYFFETTTDCNSISVIQMIAAGPCLPATLIATGEPGGLVWFFAAAQTFTPPPYLDPDGDGVAEFDFVLWISGLEPGPVATESQTWGAVKALYE